MVCPGTGLLGNGSTRERVYSGTGLPGAVWREKDTHLSYPNVYRTGGLAARPGWCRRIVGRGQNLRKRGSCEVHVLLSTYGPREDVEPLVAFTAWLRQTLAI
ncbi:hypothetical protein GCM10027280_62630 [Micromonospora polyrhachis]